MIYTSMKNFQRHHCLKHLKLKLINLQDRFFVFMARDLFSDKRTLLKRLMRQCRRIIARYYTSFNATSSSMARRFILFLHFFNCSNTFFLKKTCATYITKNKNIYVCAELRIFVLFLQYITYSIMKWF